MDWKSIKARADITKSKIKDISSHAITSIGVLGHEASHYLSQGEWFKAFNKYSSEISQSMDENWIHYTKEKTGEVMSAWNHRILDGGHDFISTIKKAQEIGAENNWDSTTTFSEWAKSYFTDLSSSAGMPMFGKMSDDIYRFLVEMGVSQKTASDFVTLNGQEALETVMGGTISCVALIFSWKKEDKEAFSKSISYILVSGVVTLNPISIAIAIMALAFGYNKIVCKEGVARGVITSSIGLGVSALIPGPFIIGLIPAIVASMYVSKKMGKEFNPIDHSKKLFELLKSNEFRANCSALYEQLEGKVKLHKKQAS